MKLSKAGASEKNIIGRSEDCFGLFCRSELTSAANCGRERVVSEPAVLKFMRFVSSQFRFNDNVAR